MEQKGADDAISFGEFKLVKDLVKKMIAESMKAWELMHQEKVNALKLELIEVKTNQEFICAKYEDLKTNYENLQKINKKQAEEIENLHV